MADDQSPVKVFSPFSGAGMSNPIGRAGNLQAPKLPSLAGDNGRALFHMPTSLLAIVCASDSTCVWIMSVSFWMQSLFHILFRDTTPFPRIYRLYGSDHIDC